MKKKMTWVNFYKNVEAMRKSLILISAIIAVVACSKEQKDIEQLPAQNEAATLIFSSERPQLTPDTKTQWNGSAIAWSTGDKIRVGYTLDGTWMAKDGAADFTSETKVPAKFFASNNVSIDGTDASVGTFTIPTDFLNSPTGDAVFYGVYPSSQTSGDSYYAPSLTITIPSTQTPVVNENIASFDKTADILVGKTAVIPLSGSFPTAAIEMDWTRVVAHADLTFKNLASTISSETLQSIKLTAGDNEYLTGSTYINVGTNAVTTNKNTVNTVTLNGTNLSVSSDQVEAWACILPVTLTSLTVDIETDAAHYVKTFSGISKQFKVNARNTLGISMTGATRTEKQVYAIADGNYVIAALSGSTYYAISSATNGSSSRRDRSEITTANFDPADYSATSPYTAANNLIWTITNVTGGVTINLAGDTGRYMQYGSNTLPLGSTSQTFAVSSEDTGTYRFTPQTGRVIAMNGSSGFGCYQTTLNGGVFDLYLIPATGTPSLTITETSKSVSASTTSVVFEYESTFLTANPTVTVTEDNGNAFASYAVANSKVTITLNENTTTSDKTIKLKVSATGVEDIALTITQHGVVGDANDDDTLWAEDFSGFAADNVPSVSNASTTVYGNGTVNYTCEDGGTNTKVYTAALAGGVSPELLVSKTGGTFTATGIPTGNATKMTLSFKANNSGKIAVSTSTTNATISSNIGTATAPIYVITVPANTATLSLTFTNSDTGNTRIDDISLVAGAPVAGITVATVDATNTSSTEGTTATLNGTITLENGAVIGDVTEAGFYYKADGNYTKVTVESPSTTLTYNLTGLTPSTVTYTYYAYAVYGGNEATGEEKKFITVANDDTTPTVQYTLTPASGSNNGYANNCDIEINGITWNLTGNSTVQPWRIGGKSLNGIDRALYSKTALNKNISKIEITHGAASSITVNSMTVIVSKNADFSSPVSTLTPSFVANNTVKVDRPDGKDWSNCYYKIVYNVTVSGTSNKFVEFSEAKFYGTN